MQQVEVNDIKVKQDGTFYSLWLSKIKKGDRFYVIDPDYRILKGGLWYKFKKRNLYVNGFWDADKTDKNYPLRLRLVLSDSKGSKISTDDKKFDSYFTEKNSGFRIGALIGNYKYTSSFLNSTGLEDSTNILLNNTRNGESINSRIYIEGAAETVKSDKWFNYGDGEPFTVPYMVAQDNVLFTYNGGSTTVPVTLSNGSQTLTWNDSSKSSVEDFDIVDSSPVSWLTITKNGKSILISCISNSLESDRTHSISIVHKDYRWLKRTIQIQQIANPNVGLQNFDTFIIDTTPSTSSSGSCEIDTQVVIEGSGLTGYINGATQASIDGKSVGWSHYNTLSLKKSTKFEDAILYSLDSTSGGKAEEVVFNLVNLDTPESHDSLSTITTVRIYVNWYSNGRTPTDTRWNMDLGIYSYKNGLPAKSVPSAGTAGKVELADTKQLVDNFSLSNIWVQGRSLSSSDIANYYEIATITYNKNTREGNIEIHTPDKNG